MTEEERNALVENRRSASMDAQIGGGGTSGADELTAATKPHSSPIEHPLDTTRVEVSPRTAIDKSSGGVISFVLNLSRRYRAAIVLIAFVAFVAGALDGIGLALVAPTIEFLINADDPDANSKVLDLSKTVFDQLGIPFTMGWTLLVIFLVMGARSIALFGHGLFVAHVNTRFESQLRTNSYATIMSAGWPFFIRQRAGAVTNALTLEAQRSAEAFGAVNGAISHITNLFIYLTISFIVSWQLTLAAIVGTTILFIVFSGFNTVARRLGKGATEANSDLISAVSEGFGGVKAIKAQALEQESLDRFDRLAVRRSRFTFLLGVSHSGFAAISEFAFLAMLVGGLVLATRTLDVSATTLTVFALLFFRMFQRARLLQSQIMAVNSLLPAMDELRNINSEAQNAAEPLGGHEFKRLEHSLDFDNVHFAYQESSPILNGVSMKIPAGSMIALVGRSGVGKTSLIDLAIGLLQPTSGRVLLDGKSLDTIDLRSWRSEVSYVTQGSVFFHDSALGNLTWGKPDVPFDDVLRATEMADAHQFLNSLPNGYETIIGDRGMRLSGGQRQRLALARAFLQRPQLLILDESTSELDTATEQIIQSSLGSLRGQTTILMVAHRFSTITSADRVYVLDDGVIVEVGTAQELLDRKGVLHSIYGGAQA